MLAFLAPLLRETDRSIDKESSFFLGASQHPSSAKVASSSHELTTGLQEPKPHQEGEWIVPGLGRDICLLAISHLDGPCHPARPEPGQLPVF